MKRVLFTIIFLCGCGADFDNLRRQSYKIPVSALPRCGKTEPCECGSVLVEDRVIDYRDKMENCDFNTKVPAITIANGAKLNCDGYTISVRLNSKGNYNNMRTGVWIQSDSDGSEVRNCKILGFGEAIYAEFEYIYGQTSVEERVAKNLSFIDNTIILGEDNCTYGFSCEANGIFIPGTLKTSSDNILISGNYFGMARSPKTDKQNFLHYGSYFRTTASRNVVITFNYFDNLNYGYGIRLLYGVENVWILGNTFKMPWERYQLKEWTPSGIGIELYNSAKDGYPQFTALAFNTFLMSEDKKWPPEPFGMPPFTGVNHEYVGIRSGWDATVPPVNAALNWWKRLDGSNYSDTDIRRLIYSKDYTVNNVKFEKDYREVIYLPRLY